MFAAFAHRRFAEIEASGQDAVAESRRTSPNQKPVTFGRLAAMQSLDSIIVEFAQSQDPRIGGVGNI